MEYIVGLLTKEYVKLYNKEDKSEQKSYSIEKFPEDVCLGDVYNIEGDERTLVQRSEYLDKYYTDLEQIVYKDKYGMLTKDFYDENLSSTISYDNIGEDVEYGDLVSYRNLYSLDNKHIYALVQNHKKGVKQREIETLYIVKKVDKKYIYLLKNGEEEIKKLPRPSDDFEVLELVYLEKEGEEIKIIKDDVFTIYFSNFLSKHDKSKIFNKNHFKITKWMVEYNHKHVLSLIDYKTTRETVYVPDYELYPSASQGDPYFRIELGDTIGYEWDFINKDMDAIYYSEIIKNINLTKENLSEVEAYHYYKEKVELFEERLNIFEKLSKEAEKYHKKNPPEYTKYEIRDYYSVVGNYYEGTLDLEPISNYKITIDSDEEKRPRIEVKIEDLPKHTRKFDIIVEVYDRENKKMRYYFYRELIEDRFIHEYDKMHRIFDRYKDMKI